MSEISLVKLTDIAVGDRIRKDMVDLNALARSIQTLGQIQPVTVYRLPDKSLHLVDGERRIRATQQNGGNEILANVTDSTPEELAAKRQEVEIAANNEREPFRIREKLAIAKEIINNPERFRTRNAISDNEIEKCKEDAERDGIPLPKVSDKQIAKVQYAARIAGIGGATSYYRLSHIEKNGVSALLDAIESKAVGIEQAYYISKNPSEEQLEILESIVKVVPRPDSPAGRPAGSPNKKKVKSHVGSYKGPTFEVGLAWLGWKLDDPSMPGRWPSITQLKGYPIHEVMAMDGSVIFMRAGALNITDAVSVLNAWGFQLMSAFWLVDDALRKLPVEKYGLCSWTQRVPSALLLATAGEYRQGLKIENRIEPYLSGKMPDAVYRMIEAILPKHPKVELFCQGEPRKRWHKWLAVD